MTIDDRTLFYEHRSALVEQKHRLLYIHGTGCNAAVFRRHIAALGPDCEVLAIDLPGHGHSEGSGFRGMADYAAACAGLLEGLGWTQCVIAGHSMGGGVALALNFYYPELVGALIMIDSGARLRVAPALIRAAQEIAAGKRQPKIEPRYGFAAGTADAVVMEVRQLIGDCDPRVIAKDWIADDSCDFMSRVAAITVPMLVVCGAEDPLTPIKYQRFLADTAPNAELAVIEAAAHWPFAEQAQQFDRVVSDFLGRLGQAAEL